MTQVHDINFSMMRNSISIEGILVLELWHKIVPKSFMKLKISSSFHTDVEFYVGLTVCIPLDLG